MKTKIIMKETVRACFPLDTDGKTILIKGFEYDAKANALGAVSGLCDNGEWMGVKPDEFEFVGFPLLNQYDVQRLILYFEKRQKELSDLADTQEKHWYECGNTFYRGFYDALDECLMWLNQQLPKQDSEKL